MRYRGIRFDRRSEIQSIFDELKNAFDGLLDYKVSVGVTATKIKNLSKDPSATKAIVMLESANREAQRVRESLNSINRYIQQNIQNWE